MVPLTPGWPRCSGVRATAGLVDGAVLQSLSRLRSDELTAFFREVQQRIEHPWPAPFVILVHVGIVGTLVALRRFRHLLVLLGALLQASSLASVVSGLALRPRPDGVEILGEWRDSALPSRPVAWLSASLVGLGYVLLPAGRMRNRVKLASAGLVGLFVLARSISPWTIRPTSSCRLCSDSASRSCSSDCWCPTTPIRSCTPCTGKPRTWT